MPTIQIELDQLHDTQQKIVAEADRRNVWISGRQSGKTRLAHHLAITAMLEHKAVGLFAPTYKTSSDSWRHLKDRLHDATTACDAGERRLEILGGGSLEVWSLDDPDSGRGRQYDLAIIDEAGQVNNLEAAWASIQPMLAIRGGVAWIISTPTGAGTYLHALFQKGQGLFRHGWRSWLTASTCNPYLSADVFVTAREDLNERAYAEQYEANWISWQGGVFTRIREAVTDKLEGKAGIIGVDWAGSSGGGDYTVFTVLSTVGHVLEIMRLRGEPFVQQRSKLKGLWLRYGCPPVLAEENGMGAVQNAELRQEDVPAQDWTTSNASKTEIISKLAGAFEQGNIKIPNDEVLLGELQSFECIPLPGGLFRYTAPPGLHDDLVMSLAIAHAGLGDAARTAARRQSNAELFRTCSAINDSLSGTGGWRGAGGEHDLLPSEYPMGGSHGPHRWTH